MTARSIVQVLTGPGVLQGTQSVGPPMFGTTTWLECALTCVSVLRWPTHPRGTKCAVVLTATGAQHMTCHYLRPGAQGNEGTIVRYVMPADSGYELEQDAVYTLPVRGGGPIDIAESTSLLWMALNHQVRSGWTIGMRLAQLSS